MTRFDPVEYKKRSIAIWDGISFRYHKKWASKNKGPFKSTLKLLELIKIKPGYTILDLACGTGIVTKKLLQKVGADGHVVGIDTSFQAIKIAKSSIDKNGSVDFVVCDAEKINFKKKFDVITCQYALFFFPDSQKVLLNAKNSLKKNGLIAMTLHGDKQTVPYFGSILDAVLKFIPDYIPPNSPPLDRFGTEDSLKKEFTKVGFKKIQVKSYTFRYSPGTFSDYWNDYLRYIAQPLKEKITKLSLKQKRNLKALVKENTLKFTNKSGKIVFPWKVLIITAIKP